jgi:hypothetical protein
MIRTGSLFGLTFNWLVILVYDHVNFFARLSHQKLLPSPFFHHACIPEYLLSLLFYLCNLIEELGLFNLEFFHFHSIGENNPNIIIVQKKDPNKPGDQSGYIEIS